MSMRSPVNRFRSDEAAVPPARLLVMLYDRLVRDLDDAEVSLTTGDRAGARIALLHAQEIVSELESALDPSVWSAAVELSSIYVYLQGRLVNANIHQDLNAVAECRAAIDPLREAWTQAWQQETAAANAVRFAPAAPDVATFDGQPAPRVSVDIVG
jgi:flagellar protein FliS